MSESPDHFSRAERQDSARRGAHDAAGERREERRQGARAVTSRPRWRYADAVQAARQLGAGNTS